MTIHPRRRQEDLRPADYAIAILRDTTVITEQQMLSLIGETVKKHKLTPEVFAVLVDHLANVANEWADSNWFMADAMAPHLEEVSGLLVSVRSPNDERVQQEEEQHQRELRQWAYERSM